ncbi:MAG: zf-HC2 domain-containing protein [Armatimonadetes bacterium]|nr:zf-HC2 domain-containing protein [Armatimonadota bacterium]MDE2207153.1 zf-HC2 domain-containing protein [Armatimonadota bacterium]
MNLDCKHVEAYLGLWADDSLGVKQALAVRRHLDDCQQCSLAAAELRRLKRDMLRVAAPAARADFWERMHHDLRAIGDRGRMCAAAARAAERRRIRDHHRRHGQVIRSAAVAAVGITMMAVLPYVPFARYRRPALIAGKGSAAPSQSISIDSIVAAHMASGATLPWADSGRARYVVAQARAADWSGDGDLDLK